MSVFRRGLYSEISFTFTSLEPLGLLETAYLEDSSGVDGQVTLDGPGGLRLPLLITGLDGGNANFRAFLPLAGLPDGAYMISGRAQDVAGNRATFSLPFTLAPGFGSVLILPGARLSGVVAGLSVPPSRPDPEQSATRPAAGPSQRLTIPAPARPAFRPAMVMNAFRPLAPAPAAQRRGR